METGLHRRRVFAGAAVLLAGLVAGLAAGLAAPASAQELTVGFRPVEPYVIQDAAGGLSGLEYEVAAAAFARGGLTFRPLLLPFGRLIEDLRAGRLDAAVPATAAMGLPGCLSTTVLVYRNTVFTRQDRALRIEQAADLAGLDVMAFQNATNVLGPALEAVRQVNPSYREVANQMLQVRALYSGRTDAVIADRRIFRALTRRLDTGVDTSAPLAEHPIFAPVDYRMAFRDAAACDAFNRGLAQLRSSGDFDRILGRWDPAPQANNGAAPPPARRPPG